jgi:hypothetical protein
MCNNKTLAICNGGYVFMCNGCGIYKLAYGTSLLSFTSAEYCDFRKLLRHRLASQPCDGFPCHKGIILDLQIQKAYMLLCRNELLELANLADEAWFTAELQAMIGDLSRRSD